MKMSQNDMTIANQTFPNTRADINSALQALASNNSGTSAPSTQFANQFFYKTGDNTLYIRNEGNDADIPVMVLDQTNDTVEFFKSDSVRTALIEFTDGDDALAIADGGALTTAGNLSIGGSNNELRFYEGSNYVGFEAPALSADKIWVLPPADGTSGQALVTNGSGTLSFSTVGGIPARPNVKPIVINGDMQISTRGSSASGQTGNGFVCDRFGFQMSGGTFGTWTMSQVDDRPTGTGFPKAWKWDCTTADGSLAAGHFGLAHYRMEGRDLQMLKKGTSSAQKVTVSFHTKSAKTGTYILELFDTDNNRFISKSYTISQANTWEQKVIVFDADTTGTIANDTGGSLALSWWLGAGSTYSGGTLQTSWGGATQANRAVGVVNLADSTSNNWYLSGVQIEVGEFTASTLPPFQHEGLQDSQMRCARYFQKMTAGNNNFVGRGFSSDGGGRGATIIDSPCAMRGNPTVTTSAASTFKFQIGTTTSGNGTSFIVKTIIAQAVMNEGQGFNGSQNFVVWLDIAASGLSNGAFTRGVSNGGSTVELSAEL